VLGYSGDLLITSHENREVIFWDVKRKEKLEMTL